MRPTQATIDLSAIRHNIRQIQNQLETGVMITAVVKANAYGHGAVRVAQTALAAGASCLAVAIPEEGIELREAGIQAPIIILGLIFPEQAHEVVKYSLLPAISNIETARQLSLAANQLSKTANIMVKVDTGMSRIGIRPEQTLKFCKELEALSNIRIAGLFTHLATADAADKTYTYKQLCLFNNTKNTLLDNGFTLPYISAANSAAVIDLPNSQYNMVRIGISMYGLPPSDEMHRVLDLKPALTLTTKVAFIKYVPENTAVSYSCTYTTPSETYLATLPIGYADGYSRHLSNNAQVLIKGIRRQLVGRVCMDQVIVDLGPTCDAQPGDEVVLIGSQGSDTITATELAAWSGTINYEIVTTLAPRVPRIYINE